MPRLVLGLLTAALLTVTSASGQDDEGDLQQGRSELESMRKEIEKTEREVADLAKRETVTRRQINEIGAAMKTAMDLRFAYERQVERLGSDVQVRSTDLDSTRVRKRDLQRRLSNHITRIYKRGKPAYLAVLFGADDFGAGLRRARYVSEVLGAERTLMKEYREESERLEVELTELRERQGELTDLRSEQVRESQRMERMQAEHAKALDKTTRERAQVEAALATMQESAKQLEALLQKLERQRIAEERGRKTEPPVARTRPRNRRPSGDPRKAFVPSESFDKFRGKLKWPAAGKVLARYGKSTHPKYGTATFNSGIDVEAKAGDSIRAVAAGQVEFVDWVSGYGKTVILSHGGGYYTLYAHASRVLVSPGDQVDARETIALVGHTDSLRGDCLHFELRKGGKAVDPLPWLIKP